MIKLEGVSKQLDKFSVKDISLTIPDGYITGLIGRNGAGKTTLFHLILGLYRPDAGSVTINGMQYDDSERVIREQLGVVLQERLFEADMTLEANAQLYGQYYPAYKAGVMQELLQEFELKGDQKYKTLSKGEELKFQFAFALAHEPKILLLDEPTGNFDPEFREIFWQKLQEFIADGSHSVVLATHLTDDLDRMADYLIYMDNGRIHLAEDIETIRENYRIIQGENYKLKRFQPDYVIALEEGPYGGKALVRHKKRFDYDGFAVAPPTIEELMYFMEKQLKRENR